jgi:hypothetical protein
LVGRADELFLCEANIGARDDVLYSNKLYLLTAKWGGWWLRARWIIMRSRGWIAATHSRFLMCLFLSIRIVKRLECLM